MLQPEFARLLAETDADAFLFDAFSNPSPKMIRERLDAFVATLVKAHPDKPLIFMQTHWHTAGNLDQEAAKFHRERIDTADGMMRRLAKQYDNVYFLDGEWFFGRDAEGTIDCDRDGLLYTSVPQNGNWSVKVDGKPAEIKLVGDCMVAVNLTKGVHTVRLMYHNAAFSLGWKISLVCAAVFGGLAWSVYRPDKKYKK